jgi:hypothetical protein
MTKPIYFPHTYISPASAAALRSVFTDVVGYQAVSGRLSPDMREMAESGFLEMMSLSPEVVERLDRILQEFERWGRLLQGGAGLLSVFLSNRPSADPLTADGTAGQIAAEIRRRPSGASPDPEALMRAAAFLQLVHEADRQRCEVSDALQRCERAHAELLDALAGEDARLHGESVELPGGFRMPESDSFLEQRVRAWARLFVHRPYPGPVFVTSSPEVVGLLAEKFPALRRIGRSAVEPAAAGLPAVAGPSAAGGFMARLEILAIQPLPDAGPSDEGGNDALWVYAVPDVPPLRLFATLAEGGEAAEAGAAEPDWRHTIVVELSRRALQPSLQL